MPRRVTPTGMPRGYIPQEPTLLWGSIPVDEIEGHEPDPAYDVRSSSDGLGVLLPMRADMLGRRREGRERRARSVEDLRGKQAVVSARGPAVLSAPGTFDRVQPVGPGDGATSEGFGFGGGFDLESMLPLLVLGGVLLFMVKR